MFFFYFFFFFFFFFHWHYSPLWALACRKMSFHFFLSATNSLHLLTPSTWRSLSTSSFHLFLGLPLLLVPSSSWLKIFLGILSSSIISKWPNQLILCPFNHFTVFSPLLISSSSRFVRLFHSPFSYLGPYILLNIFLSTIFSRVIWDWNMEMLSGVWNWAGWVVVVCWNACMTSEAERLAKTKEKLSTSDLESRPDSWLFDLYWLHSTTA